MKQVTTYILLIILIIFLMVLYVSVPAKKPTAMKQSIVPQAKTNFITKSGDKLYLNNAPYRSIGVNRYNLLSRFSSGEKIGCSNDFSDYEIADLFSQLHNMGVTTVRFWLFQDFTKSGDDMSRFDYILDVANQNGIRVIPVLENHWSDCTQGDVKTADWYASGYQYPYGSYQLSLKDYMQKVIPQYKDNTTIAYWEIMNEAQDSDEQGLYNFAKDVTAYAKTLDSNHLVSLGLIGTKETSDIYRKIGGIGTIDILDYHDYDQNNDAIPQTLHDRLAEAKALNKPLIIGESGMKDDDADRANAFDKKINAYFQSGGSIYLIWSFGDSYVTNDGFNFSSSDPVVAVIKKEAAKIAKNN